MTPQLAIALVPLLGNSMAFTVEAAVCGSIGVLGRACATPLATPWIAGASWLQGPLAIASVTINGMNGAQGAGRCAGPLVVQTALALAGVILAAQAGRSMSVALGGLALTDGCEVWSRWA